MTGEVGLGQQVLGGARSPEAQALAGSLDGLRVNRANVLQVRNALKAESDRLRRLMALHAPMLQVGECGPDPVSAPAAGLFNAKIRAMVAQCNGYVRALGEAADALGQTAQSYGYNEGQIAASFQSYEDGQRSAPPAADPPAMAPNPSISYPGPNGAPR